MNVEAAAGSRIGTDLVFTMLNDIRELPLLLTADEAAGLLRTTRKAIYVMAARRRLPGVTHVGRRMLVRRDDLPMNPFKAEQTKGAR
jgi:excisionase family DNA binding protein